jgi:phospholipase/carboxylesterase
MSMERSITRRRFVEFALWSTAALACGTSTSAHAQKRGARLLARPTRPKQRAQPGRHSFGLASGRDGYLSVPANYRPETPIPFILMLHGAGGSKGGLDVFCEDAAKQGIAVAVPESRGLTWDRIKGGFGPDIDFLDRALQFTFDRVAVDPRRLAIAGFSDGGSYALSVGLSNGDLFSRVIAYSPEFVAAPTRFGKPPIFITHGVQDNILSVNVTESMVRQLKLAGYTVEFKEFTGGHFMRPDLVRESLRWFVGTGR